MKVEVVIYPRQPTIESYMVDGKRVTMMPGEQLDPDRATVTCYKDLEKWILRAGMRLVMSGTEKYWLCVQDIEAGDLGYTHYDIPTLPSLTNYKPLAQAIWSVVDLHVAFDMGKPREHLRHAS